METIPQFKRKFDEKRVGLARVGENAAMASTETFKKCQKYFIQLLLEEEGHWAQQAKQDWMKDAI